MAEPTEREIFQALFAQLLIDAERQRPADPFWLEMWRAADASRADRTRAAEWRDTGSVDWAAQREAAADAHDALWDAKVRAHTRRA